MGSSFGVFGSRLEPALEGDEKDTGAFRGKPRNFQSELKGDLFARIEKASTTLTVGRLFIFSPVVRLRLVPGETRLEER